MTETKVQAIKRLLECLPNRDIALARAFLINRDIEVPEGVDVIANLRDSKKIRGPIKGPATTMRLVNKTKDGDTLEITFYGKDFKVFSIGKDFYEAEKSIISK